MWICRTRSMVGMGTRFKTGVEARYWSGCILVHVRGGRRRSWFRPAKRRGVEVEVDPLLLTDALKSENVHRISSDAHSPGVSTGPPSPSSALHPATPDPPPSLITLSRTLIHLTPLGCPLRTTKRQTSYYLKVRRPLRMFFFKIRTENAFG